MSLADLMGRYSSEDACKELLRDMRWPDGVRCPRCEKSTGVYALKARPFHWACKNKDCGGRNGYRFSVITKTIFENTNIPLPTWFQVIYLLSQSKKGMSALQIHRQIKSGDYRTAWFMLHRIRAAMKDESFPKLMGRSRSMKPTLVAKTAIATTARKAVSNARRALASAI
jgi:Transposase zinc-ribbon domain